MRFIHAYIHTHTYIYRERERERSTKLVTPSINDQLLNMLFIGATVCIFSTLFLCAHSRLETRKTYFLQSLFSELDIFCPMASICEEKDVTVDRLTSTDLNLTASCCRGMILQQCTVLMSFDNLELIEQDF